MPHLFQFVLWHLLRTVSVFEVIYDVFTLPVVNCSFAQLSAVKYQRGFWMTSETGAPYLLSMSHYQKYWKHKRSVLARCYLRRTEKRFDIYLWIYLTNSKIWYIAIEYFDCNTEHDGVITWKHFPRYWPFVRGIHRSPVNSPHKGQWRGALMFSLIGTWLNSWVN